MDDDDVPDTRVFVSGLPTSFTSEQLGAHFAMRYQVTDAVVVPGRRIGFVGFRNYTLAKSAVKYFDKSYIRMSKISVEIARPVEINRDGASQAAPVSQKAVRQHAGTNRSLAQEGNGSNDIQSNNLRSTPFQPYVSVTSTLGTSKRKRDVHDHEKKPGFNEFMDTMQPGSSKPTWGNGEQEADSTGDSNREKVQKLSGMGGESEAQELSKKDKTSKSLQKSGEVQLLREEGDVSAGGPKEKKTKKAKASTDDMAPDATNGTAGVTESDHDAERKARKKEKKIPVDLGNVRDRPERELDAEVSDSQESRIAKKKRREQKKLAKAKGGVESLDDETLGLNEDEADHPQLNETKSDSDWLRGKTSRVLDLTGDVGIQPFVGPDTSREDDASASSGYDELDTKMPAPAPEVQHEVDEVLPSGRLFVRNLPYGANEAEIESLFSRSGKVNEVHIVRDARTSISKGLAYVQYQEPSAATQSLQKLDGASFQGRLLHILPALDKKSQQLDEYELSKLPLKKQKELKRKREASNTTFSWNSLYMNPDAVISSVADRLGVSKADLLDPASSDAAVKQAHAETHIIQETKSYFAAKGVNVDAFHHSSRDDKTLLVKNFTFGVTPDDLRQIFEPFGQISQVLLPPTGTIAIIQYIEAGAAAQALKQVAYKNLKGSVLFLEKGPHGLFDQQPRHEEQTSTSNQDTFKDTKIISNPSADTASSTLFVRNLNFSTSTARLTEVFKPLNGFLSARVKTRTDPKRPGEILSMGFGFVVFRTSAQAEAAMSVMNGHKLDDHELLIKAAHRSTDAAEETRRQDNSKKAEFKTTKIAIKNLPFEASKKDIRSLFGAYGQLRSVRVPKKFDNSTRGFAFADFVNAKEAENAIEALKNTHLLGRRLVIEFATADAVNPEDEIRAMEQKVSQQADTIHLNKMTGSVRRKFNVEAREDAE